jgi:hypothetical protein
MAQLRKGNFEPFVNQIFTIRSPDGRTIPVKLVSITTGQISHRYESFTLNFDPPPDAAALPDDSYVLENEEFGQAVIFISPTPTGLPVPPGYYYEAVFNVYLGDENES